MRYCSKSEYNTVTHMAVSIRIIQIVFFPCGLLSVHLSGEGEERGGKAVGVTEERDRKRKGRREIVRILQAHMCKV